MLSLQVHMHTLLESEGPSQGQPLRDPMGARILRIRIPDTHSLIGVTESKPHPEKIQMWWITEV